ncbi:MAG: hypothetical protein V2I31_02910 [Mariniphaga sp.]|jgi:hypothetical protein|nr:hypothetical protein [Mariniphaga sp.]
MPYRRLPTTDKARLRAMDAALNTAADRDAGKLAFSKNTLFELKSAKSNFENHLKHYEFDLKTESEKSAGYKAAFEKAKLYVSHFIQVLFMNIEREELKKEVLSFYGLEDFEGKIPSLSSEEEILTWGKKIIQGEQKRMQNGGSPIYNPSIALVKVNVENFNEAAVFQQTLKRNTLRSYEKMQQLRKETNDFISRMWTEIEENMGNVPPKVKRQRAQEYGVVYVFRRNEKKKIRVEGMQVDLMFEFN